MYGIIHKSLKEMVVRDFGLDRWEEIEGLVDSKEDAYVSMQSYSDDVTYDLIGAASKVLGAPVDDCLELFGKYWILDTAPASYADILDATGSEILSFINNINSLHDRITSTFPNYLPPEFYIESKGDEIYSIDYVSTRLGLSAFVIGLLNGLGIRFKCALEIIDAKKMPAELGEHWVYKVRIPGK